MDTKDIIDTITDKIVEIARLDKEGKSADAHLREDALWEFVLIEIARGADNPHILALHALKTKQFGFARIAI